MVGLTVNAYSNHGAGGRADGEVVGKWTKGEQRPAHDS